VTLDPQARRVQLEGPAAPQRQPRDVHDPGGAPQPVVGVVTQWCLDVLGVPGLDGLHERGRLGRRPVDALALGHGETAGVGPHGHVDRQADDVEPGHVGEPGDPELADPRLEGVERRLW
jgi:hypothetical protein